MPRSSIRYLLRAFIGVAALGTLDTRAAVPTGLIGSWIVSQIGHPQYMQEAAAPYEVKFRDAYESSDPLEVRGVDIVRVAIRANVDEGCFFQARGNLLVGTRNISPEQTGSYQLVCTSIMSGGIDTYEVCEMRADNDACSQQVIKESELINSVLMTDDDLEWRRSKGKLILYSPTKDVQIVLVPNPLR